MRKRSIWSALGILVILISIAVSIYRLYPEQDTLIVYNLTSIALPTALIITFLMVFIIEPYMNEMRNMVDEIKKISVQEKNSDTEEN